jgi:hypothetical protein
MLQIGEQYYEDLTFDKVDSLINEWSIKTEHSKYLDVNTFRKN